MGSHRDLRLVNRAWEQRLNARPPPGAAPGCTAPRESAPVASKTTNISGLQFLRWQRRVSKGAFCHQEEMTLCTKYETDLQ